MNRYTKVIKAALTIKHHQEEISKLRTDIANNVLLSEIRGNSIDDDLMNEAIDQLKICDISIEKRDYVKRTLCYKDIKICLHDEDIAMGIKNQVIKDIHKV